jgi:hypothetical protein
LSILQDQLHRIFCDCELFPHIGHLLQNTFKPLKGRITSRFGVIRMTEMKSRDTFRTQTQAHA